MKRILAVLLFSSFVILPHVLNAQSADPEKGGPTIQRADAVGTHFIVGFMQNDENTSVCAIRDGRQFPEQRIAIAARDSVDVTFRYPNGTELSRTLAPFEIWSLTLNGEQYECLGEGICNKSFEITSDEPVSLYCYSSKPQTSDGYLALPTSAWGREYVTANYYVDHYTTTLSGGSDSICLAEPRQGEFAVIAAEDSTLVTIYPAVRTRSGGTPNKPLSKMLMKGQIWQVQDGGTVRGGTDLTGSRVSADKPVGLLSGHVRAAIPWEYDSKDHLIEMLPPVEALGHEYVVVPFGGRNGGDMVRIIAAEEGTTNFTVTTSEGTETYQLGAKGRFKELIMTKVSAVESDQPLLVAHYSQSKSVDPDAGARFDPYLVVTTPVSQFQRSAVFQTMPNRGATREQFDQHFVTVVAHTEGVASLRINGTSLLDDPRIIAQGSVDGLDSQYVWATLRIPDDAVFAIEGNSLFGGYVYGIGDFDSYGWPIAGAVGEIKVDTLSPFITVDSLCGRERFGVHLRDNREQDWGIAEVVLVDAVSVDVIGDLNPRSGSAVHTFDLRLLDGAKEGNATIVVRDLAGNADTFQLEFRAAFPTLSHESVTLNNVNPNQEERVEVTVDNRNADLPIRVDSVWLHHGAKGWRVNLSGSVPFVLLPNSRFTIPVLFKSATIGTFNDVLLVKVNCRVYEIPLRVTMGGPRIRHQDSIRFGSVWIGEKKCVELLVSNTGATPLTISSILVTGGYYLDTVSVPDNPVVIPPGGSVTLTICFAPERYGRLDGIVQIETDDPENGMSVVFLSGNGIDETGSVDEAEEVAEGSVEVRGRSVLLRWENDARKLSDFRLYNLFGQAMGIDAVKEMGRGEWKLEMPEGLPSGVYIVAARNGDDRIVMFRFVVVK